MSKNIQLTTIQMDYKQHVAKQKDLQDAALNRITKIREEITLLDNEKTKLEKIINTLNKAKIS